MKTGVFNLPMEVYLQEHGINQSGLKRLARSPAHYAHYRDNPDPPTDHQKLGTITHLAVFEPHLLNGSHWMRPANYENKKGDVKKWNGNATECKDWLAAHQDRHIITAADYVAIEGMAKAIFNHPGAAKALGASGGRAEQSLFCEDPDTGLQLKCRTDWLAGNAIVDLKKCQDASPLGFSKCVSNFWYDLQAAFDLKCAGILGLQKEVFIFIAVEDKPPYAVGVYQLDEESVATGRSKFQRLLKRYLECAVEDRWPAYSKDVEFLSVTRWAASAESQAAQLEDTPRPPALEI